VEQREDEPESTDEASSIADMLSAEGSEEAEETDEDESAGLDDDIISALADD
jgi:hypothetical protein